MSATRHISLGLSFYAGVLSASVFWCLGYVITQHSPFHKKENKGTDDSDKSEKKSKIPCMITSGDNDKLATKTSVDNHPKLTSDNDECYTASQNEGYNPWKGTTYDENKVTKSSSSAVWDTIKNRIAAELPVKEKLLRKRIRWPWESLRQHLRIAEDGVNDGSNKDPSKMDNQPGEYADCNDCQSDDNDDASKKYATGESSIPNTDQQTGCLDGRTTEDFINKNGDENDKSDDGKASSINRNLDEKTGLCIGSIFGLDVGGTLAKLVYFEKHQNNSVESLSLRSEHYHQAGMARAVLEARYGKTFNKRNRNSDGNIKVNANLTSDNDVNAHETALPLTPQFRKREDIKETDKDLKMLWRIRQGSLPDDLNLFAEEGGLSCSSSLGFHSQDLETSKGDAILRDTSNVVEPQKVSAKDSSKRVTIARQTSFADDNGVRSISDIKRSKSMVNISNSAKHAKALDRFYDFARKLDSYEMGVKEQSLSFYSRVLGGEFHFIQFETRHMRNAMDLIRAHNLHLNIVQMGATGGGAHKYAAEWKQILGIKMTKQEEMDSLVAGMQFVMADVSGECYTFKPKQQNEKTGYGKNDESDEDKKSEDDQNFDSKDKYSPQNRWSWKVERVVHEKSESYPYLLVMIGTGVSVIRVDGPRKHERVSGSTIGGGTYWGLCRLLTDIEDFESVMNLAERGDPSKVDMMVGDIYGKNSDALEKLGLPADIVASSFGKLVAKRDPAAGLKQEDLARALLLMVTNNIGQVAYLNAQLHNTKHIYFLGNFLRHNVISQQRLSYAINYWSKGKMEALFLKHEGYYGALGAFLLSQGIMDTSRNHYTHGNVLDAKFLRTLNKTNDGHLRKKRSLTM